MDRDVLNFFSPFERLEAGHENQLTRALLVLLRLSPLAHVAWLRLVDPARRLYELPPARFDTQRAAVRLAGKGDEPVELVSVFLAPEEPVSGGGIVTETDRGQVLDAIINYGGELLVVIENKIVEADDLQARHINVTGARAPIREGQEAVVVLWRDVLEAFTALRERHLVGGAEVAVLDDFLTYTEDHFSALGPFRSLRLAQGNVSRQNRRLRQVLGEAVGAEAVASPNGPYASMPGASTVGANAYLGITDEGTAVELALYPADTLSQARTFYRQPGVATTLRELLAQGWNARPNFHFGHMQRGFCWTCNHRELNEYVELWTQRINNEREVPRDRWDGYWTWLEHEHIACPEDRAEFNRHFNDTKRQNASPRPGLHLTQRWPLAEAEAVDARGELQHRVSEALSAALTAFGAPPL